MVAAEELRRMGVIQQLRESLTAHSVEWHEDAEWLHIVAETPNGFAIDISTQGPPYMVIFDQGWHEHFDDEKEALECVVFGLSGQCRLRKVHRGGTTCSWPVEQEQEGEWGAISTVGLVLIPFWRRRTVIYLRNQYIREQPGAHGTHVDC
jgi:hypothetical protein